METIFNIKELRKDLVTKRVIELNIGLREAATLIGTSSATLSRIENAKLCDVETFAKCCIWLETKSEKYFRIVGKRQDGITFKKKEPQSFPHHSID